MNLSHLKILNRSTIMDAANIETPDVIRLKRDETAKAWTMATDEEWTVLPWADTADVVSVVMWLKSRFGGTPRVLFES
jgi:hypothetical protein